MTPDDVVALDTCHYCGEPIIGAVTRVGAGGGRTVNAHYTCWRNGVDDRHRVRREAAHAHAAAVEDVIREHRACCDGVILDALVVAVEALLVDAAPHDLSGAQVALARINDLLTNPPRRMR